MGQAWIILLSVSTEWVPQCSLPHFLDGLRSGNSSAETQALLAMGRAHIFPTWNLLRNWGTLDPFCAMFASHDMCINQFSLKGPLIFCKLFSATWKRWNSNGFLNCFAIRAEHIHPGLIVRCYDFRGNKQKNYVITCNHEQICSLDQGYTIDLNKERWVCGSGLSRPGACSNYLSSGSTGFDNR